MNKANKTETRTLRLTCSHDEMANLHRFLYDASYEILGEQVDKELVDTIVLAVHEAFTNIVRHAYADNIKEDILAYCRPKKEGIEVELVDQGVKFHPLMPPTFCDDPILEKIQDINDLNDLEEEKITGGHGIPIIQAAATSTKYRRSPSGENHLYLYFEVPKD